MWDVYEESSLKSSARLVRGKGIRRRVAAANPIPGKWDDFLKNEENKTELFHLLSNHVTCLFPPATEINATCGQMLLSNIPDRDNQNLEGCTHEEADTRMILHAIDAVQKGLKKSR